LRTDYVDNCHLHGLRDAADIAQTPGRGRRDGGRCSKPSDRG
jgi:hypothetical protein